MIKIALHSVTDLITNSSTVIFTYSQGCLQPLKDMMAEIAKTFGITKSFDEMFDAVILTDDEEQYVRYIEELDEEDYPEGVTPETDICALYQDVIKGRVSKPDWFKNVEESEDQYTYYSPSTNLYLIPKDEQYVKLGNAILKFLYSTDHEATRDG